MDGGRYMPVAEQLRLIEVKKEEVRALRELGAGAPLPTA